MSEYTSEPGEDVAYRTVDDVHRVEFALADEEPSAAVVTAIAGLTGRNQDELDPLYTAVDPNALDSLYTPTASGGHGTDIEVTFCNQGYGVSVRSYGIIEFVARDADAGPASVG